MLKTNTFCHAHVEGVHGLKAKLWRLVGRCEGGSEALGQALFGLG